MKAAHRSGFTLIELMIAVAVAAILAGIAYPSYIEHVRKAKRTEGKVALLQQQERFYSQRGSYIAFSSSSVDEDEKRFKWYSGETEKSSAYEIVGDACQGETIKNCVLLTAKPGTSKVDTNFKDSACGNLTITSTGIKGADGDNCWK